MILQVDQGVWKESKQKNTNKEGMEPYNRVKEKICTKKRESLSLIQRRERRSKEVHPEVDEEKVYQTIKVTIDCTNILHRKEE